ncbi:hypothetical protein EV188_102128 [Actinomycetospora succinea]|uniref:DUF559 domain-containing protein n=1 Tax=Actinomycetospora succinea TaxID=663603 RepID=A0A4R6VHF5_9PSEU|nr:hypothetical protein [Actinomycetospora succinea]TDQ62474.1 hypothetical protein EV188_102128 [Actinomycetospora succinea]
MDFAKPFRGSAAVSAGETTWRRLGGPGFDHLGYDTYVAAGTVLDLSGRAVAAALAVPGGVIGGYGAAELLEAPCAPRNARVEVVVGRRRVRPHDGLLIRQDVLADDEVVDVHGTLVTSPLRTAFDLARRRDHVEAVVAVDALAHRHELDVAALASYPALRDNPRGARRLPRVIADADARAESPPETRLRLVLHAAGLAPEPQLQVRDDWGDDVARVDFGWRELRFALEYQGDDHRTDQEQWRRDVERIARLAAVGWLVLPVTALDLRRPDFFVRGVRVALGHRRLELMARAS